MDDSSYIGWEGESLRVAGEESSAVIILFCQLAGVGVCCGVTCVDVRVVRGGAVC